MLRTIWMIIEGLLATCGAIAIWATVKGVKACENDPRTKEAIMAIGDEIFDEKQD